MCGACAEAALSSHCRRPRRRTLPPGVPAPPLSLSPPPSPLVCSAPPSTPSSPTTPLSPSPSRGRRGRRASVARPSPSVLRLLPAPPKPLYHWCPADCPQALPRPAHAPSGAPPGARQVRGVVSGRSVAGTRDSSRRRGRERGKIRPAPSVTAAPHPLPLPLSSVVSTQVQAVPLPLPLKCAQPLPLLQPLPPCPASSPPSPPPPPLPLVMTPAATVGPVRTISHSQPSTPSGLLLRPHPSLPVPPVPDNRMLTRHATCSQLPRPLLLLLSLPLSAPSPSQDWCSRP